MPNPTFYDAFEAIDLLPQEAAKPCYWSAALAIQQGPRVLGDDLVALAGFGAQIGPVFHPRAYMWMEWADPHWPGRRVGVSVLSMRTIHGVSDRLRASLTARDATTSLSFVFLTLETATGDVRPMALPGGLWATVWTTDDGEVVDQQIGGVSTDEVVTPEAQSLFATRYLDPALGMVALMGLPEHRLVDHEDEQGWPYATVAVPGARYGADGMATG